MLISLNWLNKYVDIKDKSIDELEKALTMIGQEVEKIEKKYEHLKTVITAKIVEYNKMKDSDHLTICKLDTGSEILQVVCGAPNHKLGDVVCLAQIGTQLSPDFIIKKGKIRGVESNGMLCSLKELSLGEESDGIIILPQDTKLGISLDKYFDKDDVIFELEITPNRPDCLSYIGIARELSAYYNIDLRQDKVSIETNGQEKVNVSIADKELSNRYFARVLKNVEVKESPKWLKDNLESMGMKSINNIVDISNYIMLETGQPNHIFDLDKLETNSIEVRLARENEKIVILDDREIELVSDDIVISSNDKAIAIAGVMGGLETSVNENTKNLLIEVAHFDSFSIRKTSRRHNISSDSSYRFERWVDTSRLNEVSNKIAKMIQELAGGTIQEVYTDEYLIKAETNITTLYLDNLYRFVGKYIEKEKVVQILKKLEIEIEDKGDSLVLTAPSFRSDLVVEQDYFEEVIRLYGFDNIENILPKLDIKTNSIVDNTEIIYNTKKICASLGLKEVINYSFIPKKAFEMTKQSMENAVEIENPITEDFAIMRKSLMYSLLKNVSDNYNRSFTSMNFFEVSKVFEGDKEIIKLAVVLSGIKSKNIYQKETYYDYYDMKGILEELMSALNVKNYEIKRSTDESLHTGRSADIYIGRNKLGSLGQIHPDLEENFDIESKNTIFLEINLDELSKYMKNTIKYKSISKYQSVNRDLAFVVKDNVLVGEILKKVEKINKIVQKVELFDIYKGIGVKEGYKSFAISILMRDDNKTLEEKEINEVIDKIVEKVEKEYDGEIRK